MRRIPPMAMIWRLHYDTRFARPGVWMLNGLGSGIRARVAFDVLRLAEHVIDLELRWHLVRTSAPGTVYVCPTLSGAWLTEECDLGPLGRGRLSLRCPPAHIDAALRRL